MAANQIYLAEAVTAVARGLVEHAQLPELADDAQFDRAALARLRASMVAPPAIEQLVELFQISPFERDLLLLCAGMELDARIAPLCAAGHGDAQLSYPTFGLALAALPGAHWSALSPDQPLRHWQLLQLEPGRVLTRQPLRIDERILHYLVGVACLTGDLEGLLSPVPVPEQLAPSHDQIADQLADTLRHTSHPPLIQLVGPDSYSQRAIAAAACARLELTLFQMPVAILPEQPAELERLRRLWVREAALSRCALLIDCDDCDLRQNNAVRHWLESTAGPLLLASRERQHVGQRVALVVQIETPTADEQHAHWVGGLGPIASELDAQIERLVNQFSLPIPDIEAACVGTVSRMVEVTPVPTIAELGNALWAAARLQARPQIDTLAQRVISAASWPDLILPERQLATLHEIALHVRQRRLVYDSWGFREKGSRGLGIAALFAGRSGTGKTLAAEVLANELQLDLYRIDLSNVVSKYIGETEKNLGRVFDAAEAGGAILLFDEADALFGKRSEVKDSHDRYANIEVGYLLQRMEAYRGVAILTSNLKDSLDPAFVRRLRFVIEFPFPNADERVAIWQRMFPDTMPREGLDMHKLARLDVAGGNIRNIALCAAFLAAETASPVRMAHVLRATRREYEKLERPLTDAEMRGWT